MIHGLPQGGTGPRGISSRRAIVVLVAGLAAMGRLTAQSPLSVHPDTLCLHHDALHYDISIVLPDSGKMLNAVVTVQWRVTSREPVVLDLDSTFTVQGAEVDGISTAWRRAGGRVVIEHQKQPDQEVTTRLQYQGLVGDGLVMRGSGASRTIFGDNWPDRAQHWLASQDHPSDKATVTWHIEAPGGLEVVANGERKRIDTLPNGHRRWHFALDIPIPVYTMVLGAARMAITPLASACAVRCVALSVLTYPEDSAFAVNGPFRRAGEIVDFFSRIFAPFPYPLLRHVQTSTIFGGMENSTVIFYDERGYRTHQMTEGVVAHETAHQWFGDAVTEGDWHHLWLSEGFATYGAALWEEDVGGTQALRARMEEAKNAIFHDEVRNRPIIDPSAQNLMRLLNRNNYEKGSWVLHSLRGIMGDSAFFRGLREYYHRYEHRNALSSDFAAIMSESAGEDLTWYFRQALTQPGYPVLRVSKASDDHQKIVIDQVQSSTWGFFRIPNLELRVGNETIRVRIEGASTTVRMKRSIDNPADVKVDPNGWWLVDVTGR